MRERGFIQLTLLGYVAAGMGIVLFLSWAALYVQTSRLEASQAVVAQMRAIGEAQEQKTQETIERQKRSADEADKRGKRAVADIRAKYDRMRQPGASQLPAVPDTTPVVDADARDSRLLEVLRIAEEQTRQLEELQGWIQAQ